MCGWLLLHNCYHAAHATGTPAYVIIVGIQPDSAGCGITQQYRTGAWVKHAGPGCCKGHVGPRP